MLPKAFKSWPKSNKSPDLVTLLGVNRKRKLLHGAYNIRLLCKEEKDHCSTAGLQFDWLAFNQTSKSVVNFYKGMLPIPNESNWRPTVYSDPSFLPSFLPSINGEFSLPGFDANETRPFYALYCHNTEKMTIWEWK